MNQSPDEHTTEIAAAGWITLRPTIEAMVLLAVLLVPFVVATSGGGSEGTIPLDGVGGFQTSWRSIGPGLVHITSSNETGAMVENVSIGWLQIVLVLAVGYLFAGVVAHRVRGLIGPRAARRLLVWTPLAGTLIAFLGGGACSRAYWGYWYGRPDATSVTEHVERATHLSFVRTGVYDRTVTPDRPFDVVRESTVDESLAYLSDDPYYGLDGRILADLDGKGSVLRDLPQVPDVDLARLLRTLRSGDALVTPDAGYENSAGHLSGVVILGTDRDGQPRLLTALKGGEVSNEHRQFYEFALDWPREGDPEVLERQQFFYDLSGLEGLDWTAAASVLLAFLTAVLSLVAVVIACLPRRPPGAPQRPLE